MLFLSVFFLVFNSLFTCSCLTTNKEEDNKDEESVFPHITCESSGFTALMFIDTNDHFVHFYILSAIGFHTIFFPQIFSNHDLLRSSFTVGLFYLRNYSFVGSKLFLP